MVLIEGIAIGVTESCFTVFCVFLETLIHAWRTADSFISAFKWKSATSKTNCHLINQWFHTSLSSICNQELWYTLLFASKFSLQLLNCSRKPTHNLQLLKQPRLHIIIYFIQIKPAICVYHSVSAASSTPTSLNWIGQHTTKIEDWSECTHV